MVHTTFATSSHHLHNLNWGKPYRRETSGAAMTDQLDSLDLRIASWMSRHGVRLLRMALGVVFIWFGALKLVPGLSPAEVLVANTVVWFDPVWFVPLLGVWEVLIGVGLLIRPAIRGALLLLALQMPGTFMPLILLPEVCFTAFPYGLTLEGQYIIKNLVIITAALVVGGTVRTQSDEQMRL